MNTHTLCQVLVGACLVLSCFVPQRHIHAQQSDYLEIPLEALHDEKPITLMGLISSQTLDLPVPQSWSINGENWLEIKLRASPSLDAARSSLTVALNDVQIVSYDLAKFSETKQRILIPEHLFGPGKNRLTFTSTLYLPDDPETNCRNWGDPARWLAVEPGGILHLSFARDNSHIDLAYFPGIFIEPLERFLPDRTRRQPLIVLPENSTADDLTSLATVSYLLGHHASSGYEWAPEILDADEWDQERAANRNVIFIGDAPIEFQDKASRDQDYVGLFPSPWGVGNAVMIIGDRDRGDGFVPVTVFSDPTRRILLHGNIAYVDQQPAASVDPFRKKFSFEDLGYLDRTVRGVGQHSLIYRLYLPYDVEPVLAKLKLDLFHSPNLDIENSSFTVNLNGYSIAAIVPDARGSNGDPITIGLPAKRFRRGLNFIRVTFDLRGSRSSCEHSLESIWGTILSSSTIETTYRTRTPTPSLQHFPLPFSDPPGSLLVIPDQFQNNDLAHISQLSFMIGATAHQPHRPPEVITAASFRPKDKKHRNVILVGAPRENPVTGSINDLLPQPFSADGHALQEGYGIQLPTADRDASLGLLEILPSPWVRGGTVLVVTGNDAQGLEWTWQALLDPALRDRF
ncbi:MAG TPA: cellulose biosynthesis cyclic di-GMP-binding regulatory protein BcsB, partial [Anaerolineales bacterium]|nr:cellulose biosynthesis cyclic di-GMP-binding regulatory protein BcsB [Anaerolineales bacterium]